MKFSVIQWSPATSSQILLTVSTPQAIDSHSDLESSRLSLPTQSSKQFEETHHIQDTYSFTLNNCSSSCISVAVFMCLKQRLDICVLLNHNQEKHSLSQDCSQ